jgi:hypothetical protein
MALQFAIWKLVKVFSVWMGFIEADLKIGMVPNGYF